MEEQEIRQKAEEIMKNNTGGLSVKYPDSFHKYIIAAMLEFAQWFALRMDG